MSHAPDGDQTYDESRRPPVRQGLAHVPALVVLVECERPLAGGARYSLDDVECVTIGRGQRRAGIRRVDDGSRTLDVRLPSRSISAAHARILRTGQAWTLEDLGSKNGTFVNGQRVQRTVLGPDDTFELGRVFMRVDPALGITGDAPLDDDVPASTEPGHATLDPSLAARLRTTAKLGASNVPVLVIGDSGTGKEVLARWLHEQTKREGRFVAVNCGAIPATLVEAHLFGHIKGAFSGAARDGLGLVREAQGGTLFLDEIADLPLPSQAALLRVLQEREVVPVGATRAIPVDVRLVAAAQIALDPLVAQGRFRQDLFARIAASVVTLPRLRDRRNDLGILVATLLTSIAKARAPAMTLSREVGRALVTYDWPMNIRELEQCVATCVALAEDGPVQPWHLPPKVAASLESKTEVSEPQRDRGWTERDERLRAELLARLSESSGNVAKVGRAMGKERAQIRRWCRRYGLDPATFRK